MFPDAILLDAEWRLLSPVGKGCAWSVLWLVVLLLILLSGLVARFALWAFV